MKKGCKNITVMEKYRLMACIRKQYINNNDKNVLQYHNHILLGRKKKNET